MLGLKNCPKRYLAENIRQHRQSILAQAKWSRKWEDVQVWDFVFTKDTGKVPALKMQSQRQDPPIWLDLHFLILCSMVQLSHVYTDFDESKEYDCLQHVFIEG